MNIKRTVSIATAALLLCTAASVSASEKGDTRKPAGAAGMEACNMEMMHSGGMKGMKGMQGMMDMSGMCSGMMKGGMSGHMLPQLPPGNDKLQLQMHAEMMQKMGEILAKYASQINEGKQ